MTPVDDYLAGVGEPERSALEHVRALVTAAVPDVTEGVSYGMPALKHRGKPLLGFTAAKNHLSVFPFSPAAIDAVRDRLAGFSLSKGTVRFSPAAPIPDDVLTDLVLFRVRQIDSVT
ncbi:iron chaperone [Nakamurella sp. GG22]